MGLDRRSANLLSAVKSLGGSLETTAMIGRLALFASEAELRPILDLHGVAAPPSSDYSEALLQALGATTVHSFDASSYEGATHVHDMNLPILEDLKGRYDLVVDGGTLEHVFNVPQALKNCMEMLRVGGHFVMSGPANNQMGHGFWQFSPELAFRVFSEANGFAIVAVLLQPSRETLWRETHGSYRLVRDPAEIGARVELRNSDPTFLHVIARRTAEGPIFQAFPQQSDYVPIWNDARPVRRIEPLLDVARKVTPGIVKRLLKPTFPVRSYRKLSDEQVMRGKFG